MIGLLALKTYRRFPLTYKLRLSVKRRQMPDGVIEEKQMKTIGQGYELVLDIWVLYFFNFLL
jgi:hypothetical protein